MTLPTVLLLILPWTKRRNQTNILNKNDTVEVNLSIPDELIPVIKNRKFMMTRITLYLHHFIPTF